MRRATRVAIVGAGPAGATTACLLAKRGISVALFDGGKRPDLIVGESLVPELTAVFRRMGLEERVRALGVVKPGVTFCFGEGENFALSFTALRDLLPQYAYNVPRTAFDALLLEAAVEAGAVRIPTMAALKADGERMVLSPDSVDAMEAWGGAKPDLVIDATGRRRLFATTLGINAKVGLRQDVSRFAHYECCEAPSPAGQVIIGRLERGWSWQIPLPDGRLSIGIVMPKESVTELGGTPEEQLENGIDRDPQLSAAARNRRRVSEVACYANYQLISERAAGPGWAAVGDAFGFVDPMLSPGVCMAMTSAERLAASVPLHGGIDPAAERSLADYGQWFRAKLMAWQRLIDRFYDGRIFSIHRRGAAVRRAFPGPLTAAMERHTALHLAGMASGALISSRYSQGMLRFLEASLLPGFDRRRFAIR